MKEIRDIVQAFDAATRENKKSALATVVHVQGSSYRRPGARMLVTEDGQLTGAISGGCLEGDALRKAVLAITQGKNKLVIYDTTDEEDAKLGVQLGCNGIVSILFEPIDVNAGSHPIHILRNAIAERKSTVIVTGYSLNNGIHFGTAELGSYPALIQNDLAILSEKIFTTQSSSHAVVPVEDNQQQFLMAYSHPAISLIVVGAGNDAIPLVSIAHQLGWQITVVDGRASHANAQRFSLANRIISAKPKEAFEELIIDKLTAVVLMTHNYNYDLEMLQLLNGTDVAYIGLLGPAAKRNRMLEELEQNESRVSEEMKTKIYGPTGLNLGAETAEEIAVSITAEVMAVIQKRNPMHLRCKEVPIHSSSE